jgi:hypothetical protein
MCLYVFIFEIYVFDMYLHVFICIYKTCTCSLVDVFKVSLAK